MKNLIVIFLMFSFFCINTYIEAKEIRYDLLFIDLTDLRRPVTNQIKIFFEESSEKSSNSKKKEIELLTIYLQSIVELQSSIIYLKLDNSQETKIIDHLFSLTLDKNNENEIDQMLNKHLYETIISKKMEIIVEEAEQHAEDLHQKISKIILGDSKNLQILNNYLIELDNLKFDKDLKRISTILAWIIENNLSENFEHHMRNQRINSIGVDDPNKENREKIIKLFRKMKKQ